MKFILVFLLFIMGYIIFIIIVLKKNNLSFEDIDLNTDKMLTPSELLYAYDSRIRYKCYFDDKNYEYKNIIPNNEKYSKIILEVFSLKDGLTIRQEILSDTNATKSLILHSPR